MNMFASSSIVDSKFVQNIEPRIGYDRILIGDKNLSKEWIGEKILFSRSARPEWVICIRKHPHVMQTQVSSKQWPRDSFGLKYGFIQVLHTCKNKWGTYSKDKQGHN